MDEFLQALAKIIEQYGGIVLNLGIGTFYHNISTVPVSFCVRNKKFVGGGT